MDQGPGHCSTLTPNILKFFTTIQKNHGEKFAVQKRCTTSWYEADDTTHAIRGP